MSKVNYKLTTFQRPVKCRQNLDYECKTLRVMLDPDKDVVLLQPVTVHEATLTSFISIPRESIQDLIAAMQEVGHVCVDCGGLLPDGDESNWCEECCDKAELRTRGSI